MPFETPSGAPPGAVRVEGRAVAHSEINKPLKLPKGFDFYLMHHHNGWNVEELEDGTFELLPTVKDLVLAGGINRVEITEGGPDSSVARTKLRDSGWTVFEDQDEYRVAYDVEGGVAYRLRWDVVHRYPDGSYDLTFDRAGWLAWRRSLVARGLVQPPRPSVVQQLTRRLERRMGRRAAKLDIPIVARRQEHDEGAMAALQGPAAPAPKKTSKKEAAT